MPNVVERLDWIEKSINAMLDANEKQKHRTCRISRKKLKVWSTQDHSTIYWLSAKGNSIAVYEAGFRKVTDEFMQKTLKHAKELDTMNVIQGPDFNIKDFFEEFVWLIDKTIHELTWSVEYPNCLESWKPLAVESLRLEKNGDTQDDRNFVHSLSSFDRMARRP
jgi:hypothetical protein